MKKFLIFLSVFILLQKSLLSIIGATEGTTSKNPLFDGLIQEIFPWGEK